MISKSRCRLAFVLSFGFIAVSCAGGDNSNHLVVDSTSGFLRYYEGIDPQTGMVNGDLLPPLTDLSQLWTAGGFVKEHCDHHLLDLFPTGCLPPSGTNACSVMNCKLTETTCIYDALKTMANATIEVKFKNWDGAADAEVITVPAQDLATRLELREAALTKLALDADMDGVNDIAASDTDCGDGAQDADAPIRSLEANLLFAHHEALTTLDEIVEDYLALADAELGREEELEQGIRKAKLRRLTAASFLGGAVSLDGDDPPPLPSTFLDGGLCTSPNLSDAANEARRFIRESGISPQKIKDIPLSVSDSGTDIDDFLAEVQGRLARLWGRTSEASTAPVLFWSDFGLRNRDFQEARRYMADEMRAFARSETITIGQVPLVGEGSCPFQKLGGGDDCYMYAATVNPAVEAPWPHYASFAAYNQTSGQALENAVQNVNALPANVKIATILKEIGQSFNWIGVSTPHHEAVRAMGRRILEEVNEELDGMIVTYQYAGQTHVVVGSDRHDISQMVALTSVDDLACALNGGVEGIGCAWNSMFVTQGSDTLPQNPPPSDPNTCDNFTAPGAGEAVRLGTFCKNFIFANTPERVFIVKRKTGTPADTPGSYDGFAVEWPSALDNSPSAPWLGRHIMSRLERRASDILTPATEWCAFPKYSCAGTTFDARLPLENELNDNGDGFENSWRIYLQLARQAANEADFFGREAVDAVFQIDRIAEDAAADLEDICGVSVDLDPLRDIIQERTKTSPYQSLPLEDAVSDLLEPADTTRLRECLGREGVVDFVSLGSDDLCAWRLANGGSKDVGTLCIYADEAHENIQCPTLAKTKNVDDCPIPTEEDYVRVLIDAKPSDNDDDGDGTPDDVDNDVDTSDLLAIFDTDESNNRGNADERELTSATCGGIRALRNAIEIDSHFLAAAQWFNSFRDQGFFTGNELAAVAEGIRWEIKPHDFSTLYVNGKAVIDTGNFYDGVATEGPCDGNPAFPLSCSDPSGSPFCEQAACTGRADRVAYNHRLGRAAVLARWFAGLDLEGFRVPARVRPGGDRQEITFRETWNGSPPYYGEATSEKEPDTKYYCVPAGEPGVISYATNTDTGERQWGVTECLQDSWFIEIATLEGDRSWGWRNVNRDYVDSSARRAHTFLSDVRSMRFPLVQTDYVSWENYDGANPLWEVMSHEYILIETGQSYGGFRQPRDTLLYTGYGTLPWQRATSGHDPWTHFQERGVRYFMDHSGITTEGFLDAMELLCEAGVEQQDAYSFDLDEVLAELDTEDPTLDPSQARFIIRQGARHIEAFGNRVVMRNLPTAVADVLKQEAAGVAPLAAGKYGEEVNRMRAGLVEISSVPRFIAAELRGFVRENEVLDLQLQRVDIQNDLARVRLNQVRARETVNCAIAIAKIKGKCARAGAIASSIAQAAAVCANSAVQMRLAAKEAGLQRQLNEIEGDQSQISFSGQADNRMMTLAALSDRLTQGVSEFNAALLSLEGLRGQTRRAVRRALFLDDPAAENVFRSNVNLRRRFGAAQTRYWRARRDAIRMAFLAKKAIEQRFGVQLETIRHDMTLVSAPNRWAGELCTLDGLDYDGLQSASANGEVTFNVDTGVQHFSDGYVGEYVTKLENFVESYRLDFPFQNGQDTAVVSLRDDVQRVRARCAVEVPNEINFASRLDAVGNANDAGWEAFDCTPDGLGNPQPNCVSAIALSKPTDSPVAVEKFAFGSPKPYRLVFSPPNPECPGAECPCTDTADCGWNDQVTYGQQVELDGGTYRLSWYDRGSNLPVVQLTGRSTGALLNQGTVHTAPAQNGWTHRWTVFDVFSDGEATLTIAPTSTIPGADISVPRAELYVAGAMLEPLGENPLFDEAAAPTTFFDTNSVGAHTMQLCEDTDGSVFRSQGWRRNCVRLCADGFGHTCTPEASTSYCYWETDFAVTHRSLQRGEQLTQSGFARGNFNYRIDSVAVNIVGSSARDCADVPLASTCYSAGWIPYSLEHHGPFRVWNHFGDTYDAYLFPGRIEHARGLATQRYLTNPLSGADTQQIGQFTQQQLRGRPLTGTYSLRIWDEPGVNFDGIEDIQILLNYRFWTRSE